VTTYLFHGRNIAITYGSILQYHSPALSVISSFLPRQDFIFTCLYTHGKSVSSVNIVEKVSVTDSLSRIINTHMMKGRKRLNAKTVEESLGQEGAMTVTVLAILKLHISVIFVARA
jgi:hypothetical protein